jgi:hypothetical protein
LKHVNGQHIPRLEVDASYFQAGIDGLKTHKYGHMMANFRVPDDVDPFSEILGDDGTDSDIDAGFSTTSDPKDFNLKREIYNNWADLHPATKNNLLQFEQDDYCLPARASGEEDVYNLVILTLVSFSGVCDN